MTGIIYQMIQQYGFNQRIGQLTFPQSEGGGFPEQRPYSDATAQAMDEEAKKMVDVAYERTLQLMREKKPEVTAIAEMVSEWALGTAIWRASQKIHYHTNFI